MHAHPPSCGRRRRPEAGPDSRVIGHILVGIWIALFLGLAVYLYSAWNIELVKKYGPTYLSGLGTTIALVGSSMYSWRRVVHTSCFGPPEQKPHHFVDCLFLCLFLPRNAAHRPGFSDLLRRRLVQQRASIGRIVDILPRSLVLCIAGIRTQHGGLPSRDIARSDPQRSFGTMGRRCVAWHLRNPLPSGRSFCHRRSSSRCAPMAMK